MTSSWSERDRLWVAEVKSALGRHTASAAPLSLQCYATGLLGAQATNDVIVLMARDAMARLEVSGSTTVDGNGSNHPQATKARLQAARAWRELAELDVTRAALQAADDGVTQREIGRLLDASQTEVHRLLRRARTAGRDWGREGIRELVLRYRAGLISRGTLIGRLSELADGRSGGPAGDGYVPGAWDEVRDAYMDGLLDDAEYDELRASLRTSSGTSSGNRRRVKLSEEVSQHAETAGTVQGQ